MECFSFSLVISLEGLLTDLAFLVVEHGPLKLYNTFSRLLWWDSVLFCFCLCS